MKRLATVSALGLGSIVYERTVFVRNRDHLKRMEWFAEHPPQLVKRTKRQQRNIDEAILQCKAYDRTPLVWRMVARAPSTQWQDFGVPDDPQMYVLYPGQRNP